MNQGAVPTMKRDFSQWGWNEVLAHDSRRLVRLAIDEDLGRTYDWTTVALAAPEARMAAEVVSRQTGVAAGLAAVPTILEEFQVPVQWQPEVADGAPLSPQTVLARLEGPARDMLTLERTLLNFLGRLCGIASLTRQYVEAVAGTQARVYDTRKTTPGWRRLEKYAVHCGGGHNHRSGLYDAILIKDNHLALGRHSPIGRGYTPGEAVDLARQFVQQHFENDAEQQRMMIEIEVDNLEQLRDVLPHRPDIVLLDNMPPAMLREGVEIRNALAPQVELEASGGVRLETIRSIAETGVDRISAGALTHSAIVLDLGLDFAE